jgi:hypothetical protein
VSLYDGADTLRSEIQEEVREASLCIWVEMKLRLLDDERRASLNQKALDENGKHLGNTEANVGKVCRLDSTRTGNEDLEDVRSACKILNVDRPCEAQAL